MLTYYCDITPYIDQSASPAIVMSQRVMIWPISKHLMNMCNQTFWLAVEFDIPCIWVKARSYLGFDSQSASLLLILFFSQMGPDLKSA